MTKKEIEDAIWENKEINTIGKVEAQNAIDLMEEDFESRTCENCKFHSEEYNWIVCVYDEKDYYNPLLNKITPRDYGCNKFERKTDE